MTLRTISRASPTPAPRFDAKFIEDHQLIERYLQNKLPMKGARDLENWCRTNPAYLNALNLSDRAAASLKLLEASGRPLDLSEPATPWWRKAYVTLALAGLALTCLVGVWVLYGKYVLLRGELDDARARMHQGSLTPPATQTEVHASPDRAPGIDKAKLTVNGNAPQLMDVHIDLTYTKAMQFRLIVDKQDQGRAMILNNLIKDSNGELRLTFNTTGLAAGIYRIRLEALPSRASGRPLPEGWLLLEVH